jgi:predicted alpha/beta hydrolase family esterase
MTPDPPLPGRRFLMVHGVQHRRPRQHWLWWLTEAQRQRGEQVLYPQFPAPEAPSSSEWMDLLHAELAQLCQQERVVVCHSLGCALWLRATQTLAADLRVTRVLLVSRLGEQAFTAANSNEQFRVDRLDRGLLAAASVKPSHVVLSATDPYGPATRAPGAPRSTWTATSCPPPATSPLRTGTAHGPQLSLGACPNRPLSAATGPWAQPDCFPGPATGDPQLPIPVVSWCAAACTSALTSRRHSGALLREFRPRLL